MKRSGMKNEFFGNDNEFSRHDNENIRNDNEFHRNENEFSRNDNYNIPLQNPPEAPISGVFVSKYDSFLVTHAGGVDFGVFLDRMKKPYCGMNMQFWRPGRNEETGLKIEFSGNENEKPRNEE